MDDDGEESGGNAGLLQMKVSDQWKYICSEGFINGANGTFVSCKELGFKSGEFRSSALPGDVTSDQFYLGVDCRGTEEALSNCPRGTENRDDISDTCTDNQGVRLICYYDPGNEIF